MMTIEEAMCYLHNPEDEDCYNAKEVEAYKMIIKALKQEPCETIKEIPKDYKYDTETKDFLVYRHKYTGDEIHIEKPVPKYKLEQEPCEDAISRESVIEYIEASEADLGHDSENELVCQDIKELPSVNPQPKTGHCRECKWWKDSDGEYRRGSEAESPCPINRIEVFEGNGYCYMFEPQESEDKE